MSGSATPAPAVRLRDVGIRDFRNIARADLTWPAEGAVVIGANGQGKTNLLEALHYGHALRSMRGAPDAEAVRFGASTFHLSFTAAGTRSGTVGVGFDRETRKKRIVVDGVPVVRLADAFAAIPSVVLSPRDSELIHGAPEGRRRFLDLMLAATSPRYLNALQRYRAALAQRNAVWRDAAGPVDRRPLAAVWEGTLAECGAILWEGRRHWVRVCAEAFTAHCAAIGEGERVILRHHTGLGEMVTGASEDELRVLLATRLAATRDEDLRRGMTQVGPHRDDLRLSHGGRSVRAFASAGQQRTMALALRLLEWETLCSHLSTRPVILLDDPFAELDRMRADRILAMLRAMEGVQRILVVPRADEVPSDFVALPRWTIHDGVVHG